MAPPKSSHIQIRLSPDDKATIQAAAEAAGMDLSAWILTHALPTHQKRFNTLIKALSVAQAHQRKYCLADLNDFLTGLNRTQMADALRHLPPQHLNTVDANYVAAMVEFTCHQRGINAPAWVQTILPLEEPFWGTPLLSLRMHLMTSSPPPFRSRNIFIDTSIGGRQ